MKLAKGYKLCAVCQEPFKPSKITPVCSPKCAIEYNKPKNVNKRVKEMRPKAQTYNELKSTARRYFQQYIRLRDEKLACISCGKTEAAQWDGSHFFKAEVFTGLIFDEENCHKACSYCNAYLDGNLIKYREALIKKIGRVSVELLEARADFSRLKKFSREELIEIAETYRNKIKEFKSKAA